jgi:ferritin-like metal-binding protein YciE
MATTSKKSARKTTATKKPFSKKQALQENEQGGAEKLRDFFEELLRDTLGAEKMIMKALPTMIESATSEELAAAFEEHLEITEGQIERLQQVFEMLGMKVSAKKSKAMEGLVEEGEEIFDEAKDGTLLRDIGLIISGQKMEHYQMAAYGSLRTLANVMGEEDVAALLQETLDERTEADQILNEIAESFNLADYQE